MLVTELNDYLFEFVNSEDTLSILVEGEWGCGKTFNINEFIKKLDGNYVYVSLFGADSISDVVMRLSEKIDSSYIVNIKSEFFVPSVSERKKYNGGIIVFDDIERKSSELKFSEVCGLISALTMHGFKTISIVSFDELEDSNYKKYIDKTFDIKIHVSSDPNVLNDLIGDDFALEKSYLISAKDNYRIVIKSKRIMDDIIKYTEKKDKKSLLSTYNDHIKFLRCIIIALRCIYWTEKEKPVFEEQKYNYAKFSYDENEKRYGYLIANALHHFFFKEKENENYTFYNDVRIIIESLMIDNYDILINNIESKTDILDEDPFCDEIYFLDDAGKKNYKRELLKRIGEFDFSNIKHIRLVIDVMKYAIPVFTVNEEKKVIDGMIESVKSSGSNVLITYVEDCILASDNAKEKKYLTHIYDELKSRLETNKTIITKNELDNAFKNKDYSFMIDYLYKNKYSLKCEQIAEEFSKVNYYLPDLSKTIDHSTWSYCHEIARFVSPYEEHRKKFINVLIDMCNRSESQSLRDRCNALVRYNFNLDFNQIYEEKTKF